MRCLRLLTLPLLVVACGQRDATMAGQGAVPEWSLRRVTTIDPAADSMTAVIRSVAVDRDGNVYLAGYGGGGIFVFDSAGHPLRVLGREGSGPGEFKDKYSLAWVGDTLAVYDPGNGRVEFIDRRGNWVASQSNARISGGSDVRFYQAGAREFFRPSYDKRDGSDHGRMTFIRAGFGVKPDTLVVPENEVGTPFTVVCRGDRGIGFQSSRNAPEFRVAVSPKGNLIAWRTDQYRLTFTNPDESVVRSITAEQEPIPLNDSMWAQDLADYQKFREQWKGADCAPDALKKPETVWLLSAVEFDDQSRAWVEGMQHDSMLLAVYDSAGHQIAAMPAPARDLDVPYVIRGDRLYEVEKDEDDVQTVVVYKVEAPGER